MAFWPFNKKKIDQSMLPDEVSEYYKGDGGKPSRASWITALLTIIVTASLAVVLFFGGRWIYQSIFGNDDTATTTETTITETDSTDNTQPQVSDSSNDSDNTNSDNITDIESTPSSGAKPETTPATDTLTEIPDTGPGPNGLQ